MAFFNVGAEMPILVPPMNVPPSKVLPQIPSSEYPNIPVSEHMTTSQMVTLTALERTGGCISLVATMAIFVAFGMVPQVRNVQNTFIVFASVSNVGASIASVIAMDGLLLGRASGLCQAQAFMFEMFMQSDPWWSLAMAINVFLVFFFRAKPETFRKWWWLYCIICYGGPFGIALILLLLRNPHRGLVYGEATIWCWVDRAWDDIRIYTYYMLIWMCIIGSLILYFLVGYQVFQARNRLRNLSTSKSRDAVISEDVSPRPFIHFLKKLSSVKILTPKTAKTTRGLDMDRLTEEADKAKMGYYGTVITEVQVTRSTPPRSGNPQEPKPAYLAHPRNNSSAATASSGPCAAVSFGIRDYARDLDRDRNTGRPHALPGEFFSTVTGPPRVAPSTGLPKKKKRNPWVRVLLNVLNSFVVEDEIKRAYLRTSFLFALSVLVTWIPSSMNRIRGWLAGESPFEYHVATAAVLPLQGLWNAVIFFVTSSKTLKKGWAEIRNPRGKAAGAGGVCRQGGGCVRVNRILDPEEGLAVSRKSIIRDGMERDSSEADAMSLGSDIELNRMTETAGKMSSSL